MSNTKSPQNKPISIVWLRRDLRLYDHAPFAEALAGEGDILPVFVFDTDILADFPNKDDRRITFIAEALELMEEELKKHCGNLMVLHGSAEKLIPRLAKEVDATAVYCAADYEPGALKRDGAVAAALHCEFRAVTDQLIHAPDAIVKKDGTPYKVFTPYSKAWKAKLQADSFGEYPVRLSGRLAKSEAKGIRFADAKNLVEQVGYRYNPHKSWRAHDGQKRLKKFISGHISGYKTSRDFMADDEGTSHISPYLRFGLVSIRHCARLATEAPNHDTWLGELIWREFYAMVLFHFPESQDTELMEKYRGLKWSGNDSHWDAFVECRTGFPIVDAAMTQLHENG